MSDAQIAANLAAVRERIARAEQASGRAPGSVRLVAVSKTFDADAVRAAYAAGQRVFGENYAQEISAKAEAFHSLDGIEVRFIGHAQSRKVKGLLEVVSAIDTVDDASLALEIDKRARAARRTVEAMIQVNVGREPQKSGCLPEQLPALIRAVRALSSLRLTGLMTVPPHTEDPEGARPYFRALRELANTEQLTELSMGMSHDLEVAVSEGATSVRIGTAIFGARS